jgi:hypothetical protein
MKKYIEDITVGRAACFIDDKYYTINEYLEALENVPVCVHTQLREKNAKDNKLFTFLTVFSSTNRDQSSSHPNQAKEKEPK